VSTALQERPAELLQRLIRFDTTNPPGGERKCIGWVEGLLRELGCETRIVAADPERPNLIARIEGRGQAPPLLLQGHVDVVSTSGQQWTRPPFDGRIEEGYVWGRGALDMKSGVAMMLAAFMRAKAGEVAPAGDVILCLLSDEEAGGDLGARYIVEQHAELFDGVRHAIGEFGGFSVEVGGRTLFPIAVAEKQICWLRATVRGPGGHGSLPMRGGAMARVGRLLSYLDRRRLPVHVTPVVQDMIGAISAAIPPPLALPLRALLQPKLTDRVLGLLGRQGELFDPLLHNTANATIVSGGHKVNVIPSEVELQLDCRLLPGLAPQQVIGELRELAGEGVEFDVIRYDAGPDRPDMSLFPMLAGVLKEVHASARPVPFLLAASSDARYFARIGIQTYGFLPMRLPADLRFTELIHAADERIPESELEFGTRAILLALERFGG
jgi:acetylornithine deacetylase/succinyl-diaminopimelate desuccinylase-like protein